MNFALAQQTAESLNTLAISPAEGTMIWKGGVCEFVVAGHNNSVQRIEDLRATMFWKKTQPLVLCLDSKARISTKSVMPGITRWT